MESEANIITTTWRHLEENLESLQTQLQSHTILLSPQTFWKFTQKKGKKQTRVFSIDIGFTYLKWIAPSRLSFERSLPITDIINIIEGNQEFACRKQILNLRLDPSTLCFSIITEKRAFHLVAEGEEVRDKWIRALRALMLQKNQEEELVDARSRFKSELPALVDSVDRLQAKLRTLSAEMDNLRTENSELKQELSNLKNKMQGHEIEDVKKELEDYYNAALIEKDTEISEQVKTVKSLTWQLQDLDEKYTTKFCSMEKQLLEMEGKAKQAEDELAEFKDSTKQKFAEAVDAKASQFRHSNNMLTSYISHLKKTIESLEKETSLWKSVAHYFAQPRYLEDHKEMEPPSVKDVLTYALDSLEEERNASITQNELINILTQSRSFHSKITAGILK